LGAHGAALSAAWVPSKSLTVHIETVLERLESYCRAEEYKGWDPFDGLNSAIFKALPLSGSRILQLAWLQAFKRSPINLRPPARVARTENVKAIALFAMGYGLLAQHGRQSALLDRLVTLRSASDGEIGSAWGYPFPWRARAFYVPENTPNVICTAYAVQALARAVTAEEPIRTPLILGAAQFIEKYLVRIDEERRFYIAYVPTSNVVVHNANLWGAYILAQGYARGGPAQWKRLANSAAEFTLAQQQRDGSWLYGGQEHHRFIDSFHTGYNICALDHLAALLSTASYDEAIAKALNFYCSTFFAQDGCPAYYAHRRWPIDAHSGAQAIITLLTIRPNNSRQRLADRVIRWILDNMWLPKSGRFAYQRTPNGINTVPYMRWTQAWMFLALATWVAQSRGNGASPSPSGAAVS
jgi:hypothetical protein